MGDPSYSDHQVIFNISPPLEHDSFYPPKPLKSSTASREAQFEQDDDTLEEGDTQGLLSHSAPESTTNLVSRGAGLAAGIANMSNSILGAGIIGLPYALREAGFGAGILLVVTIGIVTDWTIRLIVLNAKLSGQNNYSAIVFSCFGSIGSLAVSFFQLSFAFGGMIAFNIILGDVIPPVLAVVFPPSFLISRHFVVVVLTLCVSYPLSLYRDIEKLSFASTAALGSMCVIVVSVALKGPSVAPIFKGNPSLRWTWINTEFFEAIGVISFAFVCHHNSLLIYGSLKKPSMDNFARLTHISTGLSVIACLCMSISGFLVFTDKTQGNILNNFGPDDSLINFARLCFGLNMASTTPLEAFVCREVIENSFWPGKGYEQRRHLIITSALVFSAMIVSLITCDLGLVLELAGGFSATALAYIFPSLCYISLSQKSSKKGVDTTRLAAFACLSFGIIVMVLSTALSIAKTITGGKSAKVC